MVRPAFLLTDDNAEDVSKICARLDGMPLAIELAAARTKVLSPRALFNRLGTSLELSGAESERPSRQRTLRQTIAWSYDLLTAEQQGFFRQLGVFVGGCDLEALAAVVEDDSDPLDEVAGLVDVSLLSIRDGPGGEPRLGMLQTVRAFAREQLEAAGEWDAVSRRHAVHYSTLVEELSPQLRSGQFLAARDRLELELDNIRAALQWSLADDGSSRTEDDVTIGLLLCQRLSWFWYACGYGGEGVGWLERAVASAAGRETPALISVLHGLGVLLDQHGEQRQAETIFERCLAYWRNDGDRSQIARELNSLALARLNLGDDDGSRRLLEEAISIARSENALKNRLAAALSNLGMLEAEAGAPERAVQVLQEALSLDQELGNPWGVACDRVNLVAALMMSGRVQQAYNDLRAIIDEILSLNDVDLTVNVIELLAMLRAEMGDDLQATRLLGTAQAMREQADLPRRPADVALVDRHLNRSRATLGDDVWARCLEEGRLLSVEGAIAAGTC
jgi:tetratricopeptide (TPR) repeat protein